LLRLLLLLLLLLLERLLLLLLLERLLLLLLLERLLLLLLLLLPQAPAQSRKVGRKDPREGIGLLLLLWLAVRICLGDNHADRIAAPPPALRLHSDAADDEVTDAVGSKQKLRGPHGGSTAKTERHGGRASPAHHRKVSAGGRADGALGAEHNLYLDEVCGGDLAPAHTNLGIGGQRGGGGQGKA
jgi:uncharacterized protein (DUF58 family)